MLARASRSRRRTWAVTAALAVGLVTLGAPGASAHDQLISTDPADGAVLAAPPSELSVTFSEPVLNISPTIAVTGPDGPVTTSVAVTDTVVTATLPDGLADGDYTVAWRVVSADGHPVQGSFRFTIQAPPPTGATSAPATQTPPSASMSPTPASTSPATTTTSRAAGHGIAVPIAIGMAALLVVVGVIVMLRRGARRRRTP